MSFSMPEPKRRKAEGVRNFQSYWTEEFGVIEQGQKVLCVLCKEVFSRRTSSVKRHFESCHYEIVLRSAAERKEIISLALKKHEFREKYAFVSKDNYISKASYNAAIIIARQGKPTDGMYLKQLMSVVSYNLFEDFENREEIMKRIEEMPLSTSSVESLIQNLGNDIKNQLIGDLQVSETFGVAIVESMNQNKLAVVVRYLLKDNIREELFDFISLKSEICEDDIKNVTKSFSLSGIDLTKVVAIMTTGNSSTLEFINLLQEKINHPLLLFHCILNQEALYAKISNNSLNNIIDTVTKTINFILYQQPHCCQFRNLLEDIHNQQLCSSTRWLDRGQILSHFMNSIEEIKMFFKKNDQVTNELNDCDWLCHLAFLTDLTHHMNGLNFVLQLFGQTINVLFQHLKTFQRKLPVFKKDIESKQFKYFPHLKKQIETNQNLDNIKCNCDTFVQYLKNLDDDFQCRFSQLQEIDMMFQFLIIPHKLKIDDLIFTNFAWIGLDKIEMELIEFQENQLWVKKFEDMNTNLEELERTREMLIAAQNCTELTNLPRMDQLILQCWMSLPNSFRDMKKFAFSLLCCFGSTFICEQLSFLMNGEQCNKTADETNLSCIQMKITNYNVNVNELRFMKQEGNVK